MKLALALLMAVAQGATPIDAAATKAAWRESLALELPREVLGAGEALVAKGGALEKDGEALALVSRALSTARADGLAKARALLDGAKPSPETAAAVEVERVRLALESDELSRALASLLATPDAREPRWPAEPLAWLYAGRAWVRSGNSARAAPFLARFVELAPRDREASSALHLLAQEALARGDGDAARRLVARAEEIARWHALWKVRTVQIRKQPDEVLPRLGLGQLWLQAGDGEKAKAVLAELCARHADSAAGWFHLGEAERMLGNLDAASKAYSRAIEFEPDHLLARNNRGTIHRLAGRLSEARADFERIAEGPRANDKNALSAHLSLARVLAQLGEKEAAQRRYARYVELGGREPLEGR